MSCRFASRWLASAAIMALAGLLPAQQSSTLSEGKARFDAGDYPGAAVEFERAMNSDPAEDDAEAAAFLLRSHTNAGRHDLVEQNYSACMEKARGTTYEGECALERAKSTQLNAKDLNSATEQYNAIISQYLGNVFAASGALYQRGTVELSLKQAAQAKASFEQVVSKYSTSPFADDALVGKARTAIPLLDASILDEAEAGLRSLKASPAQLQKIQLERGEWHAKVKGPGARKESWWHYDKAFRDFEAAGKTEAAALARLRAADMIPKDDFRNSLALYREVLADYPKIPKRLKDHAKLHEGLMLWQLEDEAGAKRCLEEFVGGWNPEEKHAREARLILEAIADPDSTSSVVAHYDRAIRNNQTSCRLDLVFWDMQRIIGKAEKLPFKRYVDDMSVGREDRAQMMYRLAYANFHSGYGGKAFLLAGEILEKWQPEGVTRHQCLYMRAHLLGRISRWKEAVPIWKQLVEQERTGFDILRKAYLEYARALDMSGDSMEAVFALEELQARYPKAREAEVAKEWETAFLETDTSLVAHVEEQRPVIIAKWKDKQSLREVAEVPVPDAPAVAKAGGAE